MMELAIAVVVRLMMLKFGKELERIMRRKDLRRAGMIS